ncbi:hypothetical protein [Streptomyces sp. NPDC004528]|uniref:hypothetical protein n=1 Tax=Streptomyces sp. NPDC004528 TaxID=3154550 RepID=UPI0033A8A094
MAVYGYDYYGKALYGAEAAVQYSVEPVTATSVAPGHIQLTWAAASLSAWTVLRVVRNPFGIPAHGDDGTVVAEISQDSPGRTYDDMELPQGRVYYYAIFLGVATWSSGTAYHAGDVVNYNRINYSAVTDSTGVTPGSDTNFWVLASVSDQWVRAGAAAGLSVADHTYAMRLYQNVPRPYRLATSEVTGWEEGVTNPDLFKFLSVFGHQLDTLATQADILRDLHDVDRAPAYAIESLAHTFGITAEVSDEPLRRRLHTGRASDLARYRGTDLGIAGLISTLTGWDVDITGSTNQMLNADQSFFANPVYPAWDKDLTYQGGDVVDYNGALWTATKSVSTVTNADTMTVASSSGTVTKNPNGGSVWIFQNAPRLLLDGTTNSFVTVNFTVTASGTYDLSISGQDGTSYGKTTYAIDGVLSSIGTVDHYLTPIAGKGRFGTITRYLGRYTLSAGTHTLTMKIVGKNAAATNDTAGLNSLSVSGTVDPSRGQVPAGGSAWWTKVTAATGLNATAALTNPLTLGPSTWSLRNMSTAAYPTGLGVSAGILSVDGADTHNNAGTITNTSASAANLGVRAVGTPTAPTWSSTSPYILDNLVRDAAGTVWRALRTNVGVTPGTDRTVWEVSDIQGTAPLSQSAMIREWGVPLRKLPRWSPQVAYTTGDQVAYNNFAYTALANSVSQQPTGEAADTSYWQYAGPAQQTWTAAAYTRMLSGTGGSLARAFIDWYDAQGNLVTSVTDGPPWGGSFLQRFDEPMVSLAGQKGYNATGWVWDGSGAWTTSGTWVVSGGMLSPVVPSTTPYTVWAMNTIPWGTPIGDLKFHTTFMTRPRLGAGAEQGIVFRSDNSASNFWMASRTRLTKNFQGTPPQVFGSWPEIPDGGRIYVSHTSTTIEVYQYVGPGIAPKKLASTPTNTPDGAFFGVMERSL